MSNDSNQLNELDPQFTKAIARELTAITLHGKPLRYECSSPRPITLRQVTDIGTEIQRRFSRAIATLTFEQVTALRDQDAFDFWIIAAMQLRHHKIQIRLHPKDEKREALQETLTKVKAEWKKCFLNFAAHDWLATVLVISNSALLPQPWEPHCFSILIEESPANHHFLGWPTVLWVKPSEMPASLHSAFSTLSEIAGND